MKTDHPLILTARLSENDAQPFDRLRQTHFPPDRTVLAVHLTMFHRLPGEYAADIVRHLKAVAEKTGTITADVSGLRHLGAGVAFTIASPALQDIRARLKTAFVAWLNSQDMQKWQPHITIQNKVSKMAADSLHKDLTATFRPYPIAIVGLDLWAYLNGPWRHEAAAMFVERS